MAATTGQAVVATEGTAGPAATATAHLGDGGPLPKELLAPLVDAAVVLEVPAAAGELMVAPPQTVAGAGEVRVPATGVLPGVPATETAAFRRPSAAADLAAAHWCADRVTRLGPQKGNLVDDGRQRRSHRRYRYCDKG